MRSLWGSRITQSPTMSIRRRCRLRGAVEEHVQISDAKLQTGSYAVWIGIYALVTRMRAAVRAGHARLLHNAGVDAEPILEVEFDQRLGW